jgi:hypothetical protein
MEPFRLKLKVGQHEFEAEGDQESVERQLAVWRELIASPSSAIPVAPSPPPITPPLPPSGEAALPIPPAVEPRRTEYDRLFQHDARVVSLTAMPNGQRIADSALLILLGQKIYNNADLVTGQQITDGLAQSGITVERMDRSWGEHLDVNVLRSGQRRGVKYRLTNPGLAKAKEIANELLSTLP